MVAWKKLGLIVLALTAMLLIILWNYGEEGIFTKVKDAVTSVVKFGAEEKNATEISISKTQENAIEYLVATISVMVNSNKTECFLNYQTENVAGSSGFQDLSGKGITITLSENAIKIEKEKRILIDLTKELTKKLNGFKPCVIAGSSTVVKNFYNQFLNQDYFPDPNEPAFSRFNYFKKVKELSIYGKGKNVIAYTNGFSGISNLEDGGWLFKTSDGNICFFPTVNFNYGIQDDEKGLDDDYLGENGRDNSVLKLINGGKLKVC